LLLVLHLLLGLGYLQLLLSLTVELDVHVDQFDVVILILIKSE